MTKKIVIIALVSAILSLCCGFCFAASENNNVNLGNEISSSLNKGADSIGNVADDMVGTGEKAVEGIGDTFRNMTDDNNVNNNRMWNNNDKTTTDGYNTMRTTAEGTQTTNGTMMSTTTWMWIIFAVAAVIIIAAIWYYAMQGSDRD